MLLVLLLYNHEHTYIHIYIYIYIHRILDGPLYGTREGGFELVFVLALVVFFVFIYY